MDIILHANCLNGVVKVQVEVEFVWDLVIMSRFLQVFNFLFLDGFDSFLFKISSLYILD